MARNPKTGAVAKLNTGFQPTAKQVKALDILTSDATHCALGGGSRSGKTFWLCYAVALRALMAPESRHAIFRFRFNSLHASVIEDTWPKMMKLCFPEGTYNPNAWNKELWYYEFPNGSQVWFGGLDDKDRVEKVLGQEHATIYFNECSQIPWTSIITARTRLAQQAVVKDKKGRYKRDLAIKCYYDFNPPSKRHWTYLQFIEKRDPETRQPVDNEFDYAYMLMNPEDNKDNLAPQYIRLLEGLPPAAKKRFLFGQFADDGEGQLWDEDLLEKNRFLPRHDNPMPKLVRTIIAVDPSGCSGPEDTRSDEVGISVQALGTDGHGYFLEDLSGRYGPQEWASIVDSAYERHQADKIIGESNFGGAMVEQTVLAKNPNLPIEIIHATRGKHIRAEPISTLFHRGLIHHVGYFPELEDQLCSFYVSGYMGIRSPDRADAAIWGWHELFQAIAQGETRVTEAWVPPQVKTRPRSMSRFERR